MNLDDLTYPIVQLSLDLTRSTRRSRRPQSA